MGALLAPVASLAVSALLYATGSTLVYSGWVVIGFALAGFGAFMVTLGARPIRAYAVPESVTARME